MNAIPNEFQIDNLLHQDTYLVNGELKNWTGKTTPVYSTISSTENYAPTLLGTIPAMGEPEASEVVTSAVSAYNNGQGLWPTMKVSDRIKCMENFVAHGKLSTNLKKKKFYECDKKIHASMKQT